VRSDLIENSQDREEVVESDWIYDIIKDLQNNSRELDEESAKEIRQAIEKHAPKEKKFTEEELWVFSEKHLLTLPYNDVVK